MTICCSTASLRKLSTIHSQRPLGQGEQGDAEEGELRSVANGVRRPTGSIRIDTLPGTQVPTAPRRAARQPTCVPEEGGQVVNDANPIFDNALFDVRDLVNSLAGTSRGARFDGLVTLADVNKSEKPKWVQSERFYTFRQRVELWARAHNLQHLPDRSPTTVEIQMHDTMSVITSMKLPPHD